MVTCHILVTPVFFSQKAPEKTRGGLPGFEFQYPGIFTLYKGSEHVCCKLRFGVEEYISQMKIFYVLDL